MVSPADISQGEAATARHGGRSLALAVLCVVLFLTFLDNTVVSVALGNIQSQLHAGVSALQWVVGAYALTFAGAMLGFGMVGDEFGRKRVMVIGIVIFLAGSVMSALAPTNGGVGVLIAGRAVMGFGAAASEPGTLSMIRHIYTDERSRARALGVWTAVSGVALALGPVIGGALVGEWDWRAIFWFNLVVGAIALIGVLAVLPENSDPDAHRVDIAGTAFGAAALTALAFAVIEAEGSGFGSVQVILLLAVSFLSVIAFFWWEGKAAHPLLDLKFIRVPRFLVANVIAFSAYFATFAVFFFTALYLEEVVGYSGYRIALVFLPMMVLLAAAALLAGRWTVATGPKWPIGAGSVVFAAGLLLTSVTISPHPGYLAARRSARTDRHRRGRDRGPGDLIGALRGPARALRDGRFDHEHQQGNRSGHRRGCAGRPGIGPAVVRHRRAPAGAGPAQEHPADRHQRRRDRAGPVERQHAGCRGRRGGGTGQARAGSDPGRLQRLPVRAACGACTSRQRSSWWPASSASSG